MHKQASTYIKILPHSLVVVSTYFIRQPGFATAPVTFALGTICLRTWDSSLYREAYPQDPLLIYYVIHAYRFRNITRISDEKIVEFTFLTSSLYEQLLRSLLLLRILRLDCRRRCNTESCISCVVISNVVGATSGICGRGCKHPHLHVIKHFALYFFWYVYATGHIWKAGASGAVEVAQTFTTAPSSQSIIVPIEHYTILPPHTMDEHMHADIRGYSNWHILGRESTGLHRSSVELLCLVVYYQLSLSLQQQPVYKNEVGF